MGTANRCSPPRHFKFTNGATHTLNGHVRDNTIMSIVSAQGSQRADASCSANPRPW
jgi:hypothetical protein